MSEYCSNYRDKAAAKYHGLINLGSTCYLNSVLQVLFMTKEFRDAVIRFVEENPDTDFIDRHLKDLFDDLQKCDAYTYKIIKTLGIDRVYEQQDAAEYFEKILRLTCPDTAKVFRGEMTHRTTCSECETQNDTDGPFWCLPLELVDSSSGNYSVEDGIQTYFSPTLFTGDNQMYCDTCVTKGDASSRYFIKDHPDVLILLLKRFDFSYKDMSYVKINRAVDVPYTLTVPEKQVYELYAFVDHCGDLRSGHYNATIKPQDEEETWYSFDDTRVSRLDRSPFPESVNVTRFSRAYLLFYKKTGTQDVCNKVDPTAASETPDQISSTDDDLNKEERDNEPGEAPKRSREEDDCEQTGKKKKRRECENPHLCPADMKVKGNDTDEQEGNRNPSSSRDQREITDAELSDPPDPSVDCHPENKEPAKREANEFDANQDFKPGDRKISGGPAGPNSQGEMSQFKSKSTNESEGTQRAENKVSHETGHSDSEVNVSHADDQEEKSHLSSTKDLFESTNTTPSGFRCEESGMLDVLAVNKDETRIPDKPAEDKDEDSKEDQTEVWDHGKAKQTEDDKMGPDVDPDFNVENMLPLPSAHDTKQEIFHGQNLLDEEQKVKHKMNRSDSHLQDTPPHHENLGPVEEHRSLPSADHETEGNGFENNKQTENKEVEADKSPDFKHVDDETASAPDGPERQQDMVHTQDNLMDTMAQRNIKNQEWDHFHIPDMAVEDAGTDDLEKGINVFSSGHQTKVKVDEGANQSEVDPMTLRDKQNQTEDTDGLTGHESQAGLNDTERTAMPATGDDIQNKMEGEHQATSSACCSEGLLMLKDDEGNRIILPSDDQRKVGDPEKAEPPETEEIKLDVQQDSHRVEQDKISVDKTGDELINHNNINNNQNQTNTNQEENTSLPSAGDLNEVKHPEYAEIAQADQTTLDPIVSKESLLTAPANRQDKSSDAQEKVLKEKTEEDEQTEKEEKQETDHFSPQNVTNNTADAKNQEGLENAEAAINQESKSGGSETIVGSVALHSLHDVSDVHRFVDGEKDENVQTETGLKEDAEDRTMTNADNEYKEDKNMSSSDNQKNIVDPKKSPPPVLDQVTPDTKHDSKPVDGEMSPLPAAGGTQEQLREAEMTVNVDDSQQMEEEGEQDAGMSKNSQEVIKKDKDTEDQVEIRSLSSFEDQREVGDDEDKESTESEERKPDADQGFKPGDGEILGGPAGHERQGELSEAQAWTLTDKKTDEKEHEKVKRETENPYRKTEDTAVKDGDPPNQEENHQLPSNRDNEPQNKEPATFEEMKTNREQFSPTAGPDSESETIHLKSKSTNEKSEETQEAENKVQHETGISDSHVENMADADDQEGKANLPEDPSEVKDCGTDQNPELTKTSQGGFRPEESELFILPTADKDETSSPDMSAEDIPSKEEDLKTDSNSLSNGNQSKVVDHETTKEAEGDQMRPDVSPVEHKMSLMTAGRDIKQDAVDGQNLYDGEKRNHGTEKSDSHLQDMTSQGEKTGDHVENSSLSSSEDKNEIQDVRKGVSAGPLNDAERTVTDATDEGKEIIKEEEHQTRSFPSHSEEKDDDHEGNRDDQSEVSDATEAEPPETEEIKLETREKQNSDRAEEDKTLQDKVTAELFNYNNNSYEDQTESGEKAKEVEKTRPNTSQEECVSLSSTGDQNEVKHPESETPPGDQTSLNVKQETSDRTMKDTDDDHKEDKTMPSSDDDPNEVKDAGKSDLPEMDQVTPDVKCDGKPVDSEMFPLPLQDELSDVNSATDKNKTKKDDYDHQSLDMTSQDTDDPGEDIKLLSADDRNKVKDSENQEPTESEDFRSDLNQDCKPGESETSVKPAGHEGRDVCMLAIDVREDETEMSDSHSIHMTSQDQHTDLEDQNQTRGPEKEELVELVEVRDECTSIGSERSAGLAAFYQNPKSVEEEKSGNVTNKETQRSANRSKHKDVRVVVGNQEESRTLLPAEVPENASQPEVESSWDRHKYRYFIGIGLVSFLLLCFIGAALFELFRGEY
ncbi:uncharacterized protein [Nothobranchius furzeri]|uniref:uncharacterized protein n=1 Tax=Nothobranchius furzeri TaxID=105023 RepID=UPI003904BA27